MHRSCQPSRVEPTSHTSVAGAGLNLSGFDFADANLSHAELLFADLTDARLSEPS
jgi:uncharacterized protein YjbI with pentapeptide repeats